MRYQAAFVAAVISAATPAFAEHSEQGSEPLSNKTRVTTVAGFHGSEIYVHTDERVRLRELAALWNAVAPNSVIIVEGNASIADDEEKNIALGQRRADLVRVWLIRFGVDPKRVIAVGNAREKLHDDVDVYVTAAVDDTVGR
jgi:outer membrane protein OmpA-like peptidoglycan-associated protein